MPTVAEALALGLAHQQAGRASAAEQLYRQVLAVDPNHAEALHLLGVLAHQAGQHDTAIEYIGRAIARDGTRAAFHNNLGTAHKALGQLPQSVECFRRALGLAPDLVSAGVNLGNVLHRLGAVDEAIACYRRVLAVERGNAAVLNDLGAALHDQGQLDEALACYRRALEIAPQYARAHYNMGAALQDQGDLEQAADCYLRAVQYNPAFAAAYNNLGNVCAKQGAVDQALALYRRAMELDPRDATAHVNLGNLYSDLADLCQAADCYQQALQCDPHLAEACNGLGNVCYRQGRLHEALSNFRRAWELRPETARFHSDFLLAQHYQPGISLQELAAAHAEFNRRHGAGLRASWQPHANRRDPHRRLRLGFVSPDFGLHPVGYFLLPVLERLDRRACEIYCYCNRVLRDEFRERFQAAAGTWHDVAAWNDEQLARQIRTDAIDILVDLAGHTGDNRLLTFARRPAPVQITWIGSEGTTGLQAIDYLLADQHTIPAASEPFYRERIVRMPDGYICYQPPAAAPAPGPLPALANGSVRFAAFQNPAKIGPPVVATWARILQRVPQSRLVLKYNAWAEASVCADYRQRFAAAGIDPQRLEFQGYSDHAGYLAAYRGVDLALDPFPFVGGITTCDALWMSVPVITCPGATFASRRGLSYLENARLPETIARDVDDYVERAVALAGDLPRLAALRAELRPRMAAAPLCDVQRFTHHFTALLRDLWQRWCREETR